MARRWYEIRPFQLETDLEKLNKLRVAIERVDQVGNDLDEAHLREQIETMYGHDHRQDRWVMIAYREPGKFVGHGWVFAQTAEKTIGYVAIDPAWRRRGLGTALGQTVVARAKAMGGPLLIGGARESQPESGRFLHKLGFARVGHNRFFALAADVDLPEPRLPVGYRIRPFSEIDDYQLLVAVMDECYRDMWGHAQNSPGAVTIAKLKEMQVNSPAHFNPESIFVLFDPAQQPVGVCYGKLLHGQQVVDSPGVVPEARHLNLQTPLVLTTIRWLRARHGVAPLELYTYGDFETAVSQYHALGFQLAPHNHLVEYVKEIEAEAENTYLA